MRAVIDEGGYSPVSGVIQQWRVIQGGHSVTREVIRWWGRLFSDIRDNMKDRTYWQDIIIRICGWHWSGYVSINLT